MGEFKIDATHLEFLTKDEFYLEPQMSALLDKLQDKTINWNTFIDKITNLAENKEELFLIGGFVGIIGAELDESYFE